ncbi:MAG: hypothetical protein II567_08395 [Candidatus Riflebacteria bacterium]|nr:hypothetical protein [Candidatus Riflebacteria bacterium]
MVEMKLSYSDFMRLTPRRWALLLEAYKLKKKEFWENLRVLFAEQTTWLVNISGKSVKEAVTPDMILNPGGQKKQEIEEKPIDWDELESYIAK